MVADPALLAELLFKEGDGVDGDAARVKETNSKEWRKAWVMEGWMRKKTMRSVCVRRTHILEESWRYLRRQKRKAASASSREGGSS